MTNSLTLCDVGKSRILHKSSLRVSRKPERGCCRRRYHNMASEKQPHRVQEVLQAVEDALMRHGYDYFTVVTEHGSFHWTRARRRQAEEQVQQHTSHQGAGGRSGRVAC
jgi:hypothetical protein